MIMARNGHALEYLALTDIEKAHTGCVRKGDIGEVFETGAPRGSKTILPNYIWVEIPSIAKAQAVGYHDFWRREINFQVLEDNDPDYIVRITAIIESVSEFEALNKLRVKKWLKKQDAEIVDHGTNFVDVEFTLLPGETFAELKQTAKLKLRKVKLRKWCISEEEVDYIIALGGVVEWTKSEALSKIYSKWGTIDGY